MKVKLRMDRHLKYCVKPELAMDLISDSDDRGYAICEAAQKKHVNVYIAQRPSGKGFPLVLGACRKKRKGKKRR